MVCLFKASKDQKLLFILSMQLHLCEGINFTKMTGFYVKHSHVIVTTFSTFPCSLVEEELTTGQA